MEQRTASNFRNEHIARSELRAIFDGPHELSANLVKSVMADYIAQIRRSVRELTKKAGERESHGWSCPARAPGANCQLLNCVPTTKSARR